VKTFEFDPQCPKFKHARGARLKQQQQQQQLLGFISFLFHFWYYCSSALQFMGYHSDLSAFFLSVGDDLSIKITDFSLAKDVNSTNLNDKGIRSRLLVKWSAPESLKEEGQFSEKSDVVCLVHFCVTGLITGSVTKLKTFRLCPTKLRFFFSN